MRATQWEDWRLSGEKPQQTITRKTVVDDSGRERKKGRSAIISLSYDFREVAGPLTRRGLQLTLGGLDLHSTLRKSLLHQSLHAELRRPIEGHAKLRFSTLFAGLPLKTYRGLVSRARPQHRAEPMSRGRGVALSPRYLFHRGNIFRQVVVASNLSNMSAVKKYNDVLAGSHSARKCTHPVCNNNDSVPSLHKLAFDQVVDGRLRGRIQRRRRFVEEDNRLGSMHALDVDEKATRARAFLLDDCAGHCQELQLTD
ncbi:hypothetical protein Purlil1_10615 [Purpureocillium lilacinum]|uniref:Uncharacterized protein n=1 Tax=Purpureocillium lilacinum TaxID=33203 RepID=A0ABR0BLR5_PURLI|nr:hypothetical protein Purlil1_10615 [Purpureocillium lilacinum]